MSFDRWAELWATRVRDGGHGFLTVRRDDLRESFGIGRFGKLQAEQVVDALATAGVLVYPHPADGAGLLRLYDKTDRVRPVARLVETIVRPESAPEGELRRAAELFERAAAGADRRSDHAPWIVAFDVFLQAVLGREPEGWEELRDDRHPVELAADLGNALGFADEVVRRGTTRQVAAAVQSLRPRPRVPRPQDFAEPDGALSLADDLVRLLSESQEQGRRLHGDALRAAARLLCDPGTVPERAVELGVLGLRFRREDRRVG